MNRTSVTYYVSAAKGDDQNSGTARDVPFRTLNRINGIRLLPGDRVLLERGSVFHSQFLRIESSGTEGQMIEIGAYGEGELPCIDADGTGIWHQDYGTELDSPAHVYRGNVSSALLLYDAAYIAVRDLELTNRHPECSPEEYSRADKMDRTGVAVVARNRGTLRQIVLQGLMIHDVNGNVYNKHMNNGGIYMTALKPDREELTGPARFDGVTVENCFVWRVSRWGIAVGYTYHHGMFADAHLEEEMFQQYGHEHIVLRGNYVKDAGGDAITPMYALRPLVEHNMADSCAREMNDEFYREPGERMGKVAAGIWPWKCKDALFRFNEVTDMRLNQDGMAYDADSGDGTVYEQNFSRQNEGGCVMFCLEQAVNSCFRNNVSYDDLGGILSPAGNPDAVVENNEFYVRPGVPLFRERMSSGVVTMHKNHIFML